MMDVEFSPIDFEAHKALSTVIRLDSFVTSFGYDIGLSKFLEEADDYLRRLQITLSDEPARAVHMRKGGVIVGQLEIGAPLDADTGKLNLVYLLPTFVAKVSPKNFTNMPWTISNRRVSRRRCFDVARQI